VIKLVKHSRPSIADVIAVSGGADSVYLLFKVHEKSKSAILAHVNYGARGKDSEGDQEFVEQIGRSKGMPVEVRKIAMAKSSSGFENKARKERYAFLQALKKKQGAEKILIAHTADDQVETILMRVLEGAGISGLKGIPRKTDDGIERPLLDTWREDILKYLHKHKIPYRVDKSNFDTRFERNWIRHVLIPLLEKRYGRTVKKRIFALGERFREIDEFLEDAARKWMKRNIRENGVAKIPRKSYSTLPSAPRKKILQLICFERIGIAPNERLLASMDRILLTGGPSARLNIGKRAEIRCRYDEAFIAIPAGKMGAKVKGRTKGPLVLDGPGRYGFGTAMIHWEDKGKIPAGSLRRLAKGERAAVFDADEVRLPLTVRPLRAGDRVRPFGLDAEKKVKEVLIDRKVPREERWGRPVVCDAEGKILWIPGVVRSAHAPVTGSTVRIVLLRAEFPADSGL
jgi:tRNA(Ile)-lysidine synthase